LRRGLVHFLVGLLSISLAVQAENMDLSPFVARGGQVHIFGHRLVAKSIPQPKNGPVPNPNRTASIVQPEAPRDRQATAFGGHCGDSCPVALDFTKQ